MKNFKKILLLLIGSVCIYVVGLYLFQEKFYIYPDKEYISPKNAGIPKFKEIYINAYDGIKIRTWFIEGNKDKPLILFFHGNKSQNSEYASGMIDYIRQDFGIMMMDYREFGNMDGKFNQENIFNDAKSSFDYLKNNYKDREIIVMGYSMGTALASYLAGVRNPNKVVLIAPFYSLKELAKEKNIPFGSKVLKNELPSYKYIKDFKKKLLIMHGNKDTLIPYHHSQRLYNEALGCKRTFLLLNEVDHNLYFDNKWHKKVIDWIYED